VPGGRLPGRSPIDVFAAEVADAASRLEGRWGDEWGLLELAIHEIPPDEGLDARRSVPLATLIPQSGNQPTRIVLYRRPIEHRVADVLELRAVIRDSLAERVAELLSRTPEEIDRNYGM